MTIIKNITLIAIFSAILFVQEQILSFLPNIQFTVLLIVLYSKVFGCGKTLIILLIHVILDNLIMSSFNIMYVPFMYIGWSIIPIIIHFLFKKSENPIILALVGFICSFIYCWIFIIPNVFIFSYDPLAYFLNDIVWEIILAVFSFLTILWLYKPCSKLLYKLQNK